MMNPAVVGRPGSEIGDSGGRPAGWLPAAGVALAMLAAAAGGDAARLALRYQRDAVAAGQWWRLLGAHAVHLDVRHLLYNLAGLVLLWALFRRELSASRWLWVIGAAIVVIDAGLWFASPAVQWYVGASGVLHGLWSAGAWRAWRRLPREGWLPLLALLSKLGLEQWRGHSLALEGLPVIIDAHVYGALGGWLAVAVGRRRGTPVS